jgi:hypothetical protein
MIRCKRGPCLGVGQDGWGKKGETVPHPERRKKARHHNFISQQSFWGTSGVHLELCCPAKKSLQSMKKGTCTASIFLALCLASGSYKVRPSLAWAGDLVGVQYLWPHPLSCFSSPPSHVSCWNVQEQHSNTQAPATGQLYIASGQCLIVSSSQAFEVIA